jgi:hypothetical protein
MGYPMSAILIFSQVPDVVALTSDYGSWQSKTLTQVEQNDQFCCTDHLY